MMITYGQDDDGIQWSFNPFNDPFSLPGCGYCSVTGLQDASFGYYGGCYGAEDVVGPVSHANGEYIRPPHVFPHDYIDLQLRSYHNAGYGELEEEGRGVDDMQPSSSCSSPGQNSSEEEDDMPVLDLADDCAEIDGEMGKRLNQMVPIPHVPRINGEIPSIDEATSDHQRLIDRLQRFDLVELKVEGDGNCQFRALSDQFYRTSEHHTFMRQKVINQLESHPEIYEGYVPMAYGEYLEKLSKNGEWGDHVTLQAAADSYGVRIFVITSFKDTCYIEILPNVQKSNRVIFLSFWAEVHYNSIYPKGGDSASPGLHIIRHISLYKDLPMLETKKKRRFWLFGNRHH